MTTVCITGMHRSGTSMIAKLLNLCGLDLGNEDDFLPPSEYNPEGYWENSRFIEINDSVLASLAGSWDMPPSSDDLLEKQKHLAILDEQAQSLISEFSDKPFWGWKDPRSSLTFPFWQKNIPDLKIIICLRNPLEVAYSLAKRNQFSESFSLNLWQIYNQHLMLLTTPAQRLITHYSVFFIDPEAELRRLLSFIGIPIDANVIQNSCQEAVSPLRHNRATVTELIRYGVPVEVANLYAHMCSQAGKKFGNVFDTNPQLLSEKNENIDPNIELRLAASLLNEEPLVQSLIQWNANKRQEIESMNQRTNGLQEQLKILNERNAALIEQNVILSDQLSIEETKVRELSCSIESIQSSNTWQLIQFLGRFRERYAPPNSKRERLLRWLLKRVISLRG